MMPIRGIDVLQCLRRGVHWMRGNDVGSGTMAGVALILLSGVLLAAVASAGNLLLCQTRARSVADLAAVSAASAMRNGIDDPCVVADVVVLANDGRSVSCLVENEDVQVDVSVPTKVPFVPWVSISSRAGPVSCSSAAGTEFAG